MQPEFKGTKYEEALNELIYILGYEMTEAAFRVRVD